MYQKKPPKSELPDKTLYTLHEIIEHREIIRKWDQGWFRVVSIDPGEKNLAIRIECRSYDAKNIIMEVFEKYNLHDYVSNNQDPNMSSIYGICIRLLDQYLNLFKTSHFVIIERQMTENYKMVRLSQCVITYFLLNLKDAIYAPLIYEIDNKLKTKQLGDPKNLTKKQVKQWAIKLCNFILEKRQDQASLNLINKSQIRKRDDLSDTVIQIEALFKYLGYATTYDQLNIVSTSYFDVSIAAEEVKLPDISKLNLNNLIFTPPNVYEIPINLNQFDNQFTQPNQISIDFNQISVNNFQYPQVPGL